MKTLKKIDDWFDSHPGTTICIISGILCAFVLVVLDHSNRFPPF